MRWIFLSILYSNCIAYSRNYASNHRVRCSESDEYGLEMQIFVEKDFLEKKFPSRVREFREIEEINDFYQMTVPQDQLEIEFEDEKCKF